MCVLKSLRSNEVSSLDLVHHYHHQDHFLPFHIFLRYLGACRKLKAIKKLCIELRENKMFRWSARRQLLCPLLS